MVLRDRDQKPQPHVFDRAAVLAAHESVAAGLASRGEWRRAYEHLRSALDTARTAPCQHPHIPEQYRLEVEALRRENAQVRHESLTDALTATYNRRYLDSHLARLRHAALALVDLDHFKQVNDSFGHQFGDEVLRHVVDLLRRGLPPGAFCARYGGEEFVLVLPQLAHQAAIDVAERARARIAEYPWHRLREGLSVTVSIGVTAADRQPIDPTEQLLNADSLLYAAKRTGRNLVAYRVDGRVRMLRSVRSEP